MRYSKLSGIDIPISNIIFGCCNPILMEDRPRADDLLNMAFLNGYNIFDTAKVYGKSEEVLGRWIKNEGIRNKVVIVTKGCHPDGRQIDVSRVNVKSLKEDIESSLNRLQTDYIDIFLLHRDDSKADMVAVLETLDGYKKHGIIKKIGVSNWTHARIEEANNIAHKRGFDFFSVSSPQMSPAIQIRDPWGGGCVSITGDYEAEEWYTNHPEVSVFAYSCLAHGMFSGKVSSRHPARLYRSLDNSGRKAYWCRENIKRLREIEKYAHLKQCSVSQASLAWCMNKNYRVFPIVTMSDIGNIIENCSSVNCVDVISNEKIEL